MKIMQQTTGKEFTLVEARPEDWKDQPPTELMEGMYISEGVGTSNGSIFCYWIGDRDVQDPELLSNIQAHINDHDVVGLRFIRAFPDGLEQKLPPDPERMNAHRAQWAATALDTFVSVTGTEQEDAVSDLLTNLMHYCDRNRLDFNAELARAQTSYIEETIPG